MGDLELRFLENEQQQLNFDEQNLRQAIPKEDEMFRTESLYLPDIHVNPPAYWKPRVLDVQALVPKKQLLLSFHHRFNES